MDFHQDIFLASSQVSEWIISDSEYIYYEIIKKTFKIQNILIKNYITLEKHIKN